jgi:hypothetical protein
MSGGGAVTSVSPSRTKTETACLKPPSSGSRAWPSIRLRGLHNAQFIGSGEFTLESGTMMSASPCLRTIRSLRQAPEHDPDREAWATVWTGADAPVHITVTCRGRRREGSPARFGHADLAFRGRQCARLRLGQLAQIRSYAGVTGPRPADPAASAAMLYLKEARPLGHLFDARHRPHDQGL